MASLKKVIQYPSKVLLTSCEDVDVDVELTLISNKLNQFRYTCISNSGVGLAAPQMGISKRFFLYHYQGRSFFVINPRITWLSEGVNSLFEGCLSIRGEMYRVERNDSLTLSYTDTEGCLVTSSFEGFQARIIQHEVDHLNGICICDK